MALQVVRKMVYRSMQYCVTQTRLLSFGRWGAVIILGVKNPRPIDYAPLCRFSHAMPIALRRIRL